MSKEMPAMGLLNETFSFATSRYGAIVRCLLIPYIILVIGYLVVFVSVIDFSAFISMADSDFEPETPAEVFAFFSSVLRVPLSTLVVIYLVAGLVLSVPLIGGMTSLYRLVGLGEEPGWVIARFDGPMWRTLIAGIIMWVLQLVIFVIAGAIAGALNPGAFDFIGNMEQIENNPEILWPFLGFVTQTTLFGLLIMAFVFTKLAPFVAATACENRLMLLSSWSMTKGNFWTILGSYILLVIAIVVGYLGYIIIDVIVNIIASLAGPLGAILHGLAKFVVDFIVTFFMIGLQTAFAALIYRKLWVQRYHTGDAGGGDAGELDG